MDGQSRRGIGDFGRFFDDYGSEVSFILTYRLHQHLGFSFDAAQLIHGLVLNALECGALVETEDRIIYIQKNACRAGAF